VKYDTYGRQYELLQMPEVDVFLIGVPKAGTTWLAYALNQHDEIDLSDPKEPNIIASHRGTFVRTEEKPDWAKFTHHFGEKGLRMDASIHAFACPLAPSRIRKRLPDAKFILCLREPVSRSFSHWNMVLNTKEAVANGLDWSTFEKAWLDEHLRADSMYGSSMSRWLKEFDLDRFTIIDSERLKSKPLSVLREIEQFLNVESYDYNLNESRHSNSAISRRPMTSFGKLTRGAFSLIPEKLKLPIVRMLQKRDFNIYNLPILSKKGISLKLDNMHYNICGETLINELELLEDLTGFNTNIWQNEITNRINN